MYVRKVLFSFFSNNYSVGYSTSKRPPQLVLSEEQKVGIMLRAFKVTFGNLLGSTVHFYSAVNLMLKGLYWMDHLWLFG